MDVRHPLSRRRFFGGVAAAVGALGLKPASLLGQVRTEQFTGGEAQYDAFVKIASNENNWGPPPAVMEAMQHAFKYANRYGNPDGGIIQAIAEHHGVKRENVLLTAGSGEVLDVVGTTYLQGGKFVLGADPSYGSVYQHATSIKSDAIKVPLLKDYRQDIPGMILAANRNARDIGFFYLCNPNNPTGVVISAKEVKQVVEGIPKDMPILIDEAYHHYVDDPAYGTSVPYVLEGRPVIVARTFSKAHGMAGLRLGYALGQPETLRAVSNAWGLGSLGTLTAAAGTASLRDTAHMAEERAENARIRDFTLQAFRDMGFEGTNANTNCVFIDIKRPAKDFRDACAAQKVRVGRDFPPFEKSHTRITLGTMDEMKQAVAVFRKVLTASPSSRAQ